MKCAAGIPRPGTGPGLQSVWRAGTRAGARPHAGGRRTRRRGRGRAMMRPGGEGNETFLIA
ncbi:MAG TPA: hypothetical protein PKY93_09890 [Methanothrix sp.]|nr:hypothetical protein [Methanothrix sp.]